MGDITGTGMYMGDLVTVLTNIKNLLNEIRTNTATDKTALDNLINRAKSCTLGDAALVITGAGGTTAKIGASDTYFLANGTLVKIAAATNLAALSGTVTNAKFNIYAWFVDSAGTVTSAMGTEGATLAAVVPPAIPANKACIGAVIINPTGTGNFVGGTTALDNVTVVPNAAYLNTDLMFDWLATASAAATTNAAISLTGL